mmetsp:Transcript_64112/g.93853  ORF Transcript_64112/g.93853 Transcript_64112/m.93853 type:complete len:229 (-) Transcript_64112:1063-1749(-)
MLSAITHTRRLLSIFFSWQPRRRMGTVMESAGLSTDCTKTVDDSLCSVSGTASGNLMASITAGINGRMSRFWQVLRALSVASLAPFLTSLRVSHMAADTTGTTWLRVRAKGIVARSANCPSKRSERSLVCQLSSAMPAKSSFSTFLAACGTTISIMAGPVSNAAVRSPCDFLSATRCSTFGRKGSMKGSALPPSSSQQPLIPYSAPSAVCRNWSILRKLDTTPQRTKA